MYAVICFPFCVAEDTVVLDAGECIICFEDMEAGNAIARLPCLCKFHKK